MNSYQSLVTFETPDGNATLYGLEQSFILENKFLKHLQGIIIFVHGFNSSAQIWGDKDNGFVSSAIKEQYLPYVIDFSDSLNGSIVNMADWDLYYVYDYIKQFLESQGLKNKHVPINFVSHSMGGIITRYFLSLKHDHPNHSASDLKAFNIKSVALLGVPNHGISKRNSDNLVSKMEKFILDFNSYAGKKYSLKLADKAFFQLLSGNSIITSLLNDLPSNMWPELYWMNFIASRDIVVDRISSYFPPEEVNFLKKNFYQTDFDATHMRNPFHAFTNALVEKMPFSDSKMFAKIENRTPDFLGFLTKDPIYANKSLIQEYFKLIKKL